MDGESSAPNDQATNLPGELTIDTESVTDFVASFRGSDGHGVTAIVRYSPTTTHFELRTSSGVVLRSDGTEQVVLGQLDPRAMSVDYVLPPSDPDYLAVVGLRNALVKAGTSAQPSPEERATTRYAAAYTASRLLGEVFDTSRWPYPGYGAGTTLPPELREEGKGAPSDWFPANTMCCGPWNCNDCDYIGVEWSLNNWCAAGDHCNANAMWRAYTPGGNCGDALNFHRDSNIINYSGGPAAYCRSPYAAAASWRATH
ncbi:MAG TPA: hypothetical protein VN253_26495 [Kofleriaceae bacterium]|nr:hypothetical protein [Kofleriaceae bacterium]